MSLAPSTRRNYNSSLATYEWFCNDIRHHAFPLSQQTLILFATNLASYSSYQNVKLHMAAIKHFAIIRGFPTPFKEYHRLYLLLRGIKRSLGSSGSLPKRLPITPPLLRIINRNLFNSSRLYQDKIMLWAAITTAFFGFLRISEYTSPRKTSFDPSITLMKQDLAITSEGAWLWIKASKTDPFREGVTVRIAANNTILCPINALRLYLPLHPTPTGPLFVFQNGGFLTRADINTLLKDMTNGAANVSSHSLRIGAASTAAAMGCPKYLIQGMGRWSSDCFRRYIRISNDTIKRASRSIAHCDIPVPLGFDPSA